MYSERKKGEGKGKGFLQDENTKEDTNRHVLHPIHVTTETINGSDQVTID